MRSGGIINAQLSRVLAELRHTDLFVISDSGLPVAAGGPEVVDLAVIYGVPSFETVLLRRDRQPYPRPAERGSTGPSGQART